MNTPVEPAGFIPYQVIGRLTHLYARGIEAATFSLPSPESWSGATFREHCRGLADLQKHLEEIGPLPDHPWKGVNRIEPLLPTDIAELQAGVAEAIGSLTGVAEAFATLADSLHDALKASPSLKEVQQLAQFALRIAKAPAMDRRAIGDPIWERRRDEIAGLIERGLACAANLAGLEGIVKEVALAGGPLGGAKGAGDPRSFPLPLVPEGVTANRSPRSGASSKWRCPVPSPRG